jgi:glycine cleavage system H protein
MADASYPEDLLYHAEHDWARIDDDVATMGITWFAQVKAVSDVIAPLSGEIVEVNTALGDSPEAINEDPYGEGWLVKVRLSDVSEKDSLMDVAAYQAQLS